MDSWNQYLVIGIENKGEDFVKTWNLIMDMKYGNKDEIEKYDSLDLYRYNCAQDTSSGGYGKTILDISNAFHGHKMRNIPVKAMYQKQNYGICLCVKDCFQNDTIEYEYLALMIQNMDDVICYIYPDKEERSYKMYKNISCFFSLFIEDYSRRNKIWVKRLGPGERWIEMPGTGMSEDSRKITPIIEFENINGNSTLKSWVRTYDEFLNQCVADGAALKMESYEEILKNVKKLETNIKEADGKGNIKKTDELKKQKEIWMKKQKKAEELCRASKDCKLLYRCMDYFSGSPDSKSMGARRQHMELFWNKDVQEMLKEMPLLAFYMLCIQLYYLKGRDGLQSEDIKLAIVNAGELTEGVIQLLENLHHSTKKRGFLSIRIHERKKNDSYLYLNYPEYWNRNDIRYHFEFRILDYSNESICESFKRRQKEENIQKEFRIREFFEYTDGETFWKKYNDIPENIVHHYGLQIFSTIISNNEGYFHVVSSSKKTVEAEHDFYSNREDSRVDKKMHIPGTEYIVLLPMRRETIPINPSVDADIQYQFDMKKNYRLAPLDLNNVYEESRFLEEKANGEQELKEHRINYIREGIRNSLAESLTKKKSDQLVKAGREQQMASELTADKENEKTEAVLLLSAKNWGERRTEIFCKSLMLAFMEWQPENEQGFYTIIKDCTVNDFITISRMFAIFYGKSMLYENCSLERLQIYLSGVDQSEEFLIAGKDIAGLLTMAGKLTLVRGIQPHCLRSVEYILHKFQVPKAADISKEQNLKLVPFDILEIPDSSETLFERAVKRVLESDLQKYSFGCKLEHTHMRIGSKLHINEFYEAELLFHNNYYVARFAQLIIRRLEGTPVLCNDKSIMLVGYETYSELLLYEIMTHLNDRGYRCSYMVYEQRREGKFRYYDTKEYIPFEKSMKFVLIVPINSSMTTHSKLRASLHTEIQKIQPAMQPQIAANYALILIRSNKENEPCNNMEKKYCESMKNGIIKALHLPENEREIRYFVCVRTEWKHPLECKLCFPDDSMLNEQPLIETNRESIIPIQMLGIQESDILNAYTGDTNSIEKNMAEKNENEQRVRCLGESLIYRHIVRNGNHFMFYFQLEKYFMQNREKIIDWLKNLKTQKKKSRGIIYDVIVAPLHFSNAGFVAEVNYHLYGNAALVLNFEVEKEFRDNVRTKYSNIIGLYKKLLDMKKEAELRFHFVDDNIISGSTFFRAKSLFTSLLPEYLGKEGKIKVRVFEDIIVILNRMSEASIMNCVADRNDYHAYVSLNISSMRNHEDACTLCKTVDSARQLRDRSSTNIMYEFWDKRIVRHKMIEAEEYHPAQEGDRKEILHERACRRMLCTHITNERLAELGYRKNDAKEVKKLMQHLLKEKAESENVQTEAMEWMISYVKIFSRPFVSFRKSSREAAFQIMLEIIEFIVTELIQSNARLERKRFTNYKGLEAVCRTIRDAKLKWGQDDKIFSLLLTLMQRLSALGSNYIIRKSNIKKLFDVLKNLHIPEEMREEFKQRYLSIAKRITCLSSGESKCVYLEYLLLYGEEYQNEATEARMQAKEPVFCFDLVGDKKFLEILFLENTRVLYDGIHNLAAEIDEDIAEDKLLHMIDNKYYYDNFKRFLMYYRFLILEEGKRIFKNGKYEVIVMLVKLYRMLAEGAQTRQERDVERFYNDLLKYIEGITGAKNIELLFFYDMHREQEKTRRKVYKKQRGMEISLEKTDYVTEPFFYDTYAFNDEEEARVLIKYRNYVGEGYSAKHKNQMDEVYLELIFASDMPEWERLIALKCIMMFRDLIVKNLEKHFSNNLMQKWSAEQTFKKNMKLERSSDHTDKDDLEKNLQMISQGMGSWNKEHQKALFYLVINSYIARINVQLLADALPEGENEEYPFAFVYKHQLKDLIQSMHEFEEFHIMDENGKEEFSKNVLSARIRMYKKNRRWERLSVKRLSIIITELIHSAIKYSDDKKVYIYRENNYLVVRNSFNSEKRISVIQQEARDAYSRKKEGISLAVIKELVDKFYGLEEPDDVIIDAQEERGKKYYYVKLPILEDRKESFENE